jgi:hypothetical protein
MRDTYQINFKFVKNNNLNFVYKPLFNSDFYSVRDDFQSEDRKPLLGHQPR